ncbi:hypothetical protein [Henriciella litoralis]|uniref:hypothetical protein n=1 Tax=Henriciella litoralis TaxID=568102 RepID=UPI000A079081|nr:hypothetical protein [Henriciella litoralis]
MIHRLKTFLAVAALPFKSRKARRAGEAVFYEPIQRSDAERNPLAHDDWMFADDLNPTAKPDVLDRLTTSLCRLRNCLSQASDHAPIVEERPASRLRVEFSAYSDLIDEDLFDDEQPAAHDDSPVISDAMLFEETRSRSTLWRHSSSGERHLNS